jgi:hypothetical protein
MSKSKAPRRRSARNSLDDPRQNELSKAPVEKEQQNQTEIDLEKWQESDTH